MSCPVPNIFVKLNKGLLLKFGIGLSLHSGAVCSSRHPTHHPKPGLLKPFLLRFWQRRVCIINNHSWAFPVSTTFHSNLSLPISLIPTLSSSQSLGPRSHSFPCPGILKPSITLPFSSGRLLPPRKSPQIHPTMQSPVIFSVARVALPQSYPG